MYAADTQVSETTSNKAIHQFLESVQGRPEMPMEKQTRTHPNWLSEGEWKKAKHDVAEAIGCLKNCLEFGSQHQMSSQDICDEFRELIPKLEFVYEKLFLEQKSKIH